jgi:hypothetical protein
LQRAHDLNETVELQVEAEEQQGAALKADVVLATDMARYQALLWGKTQPEEAKERALILTRVILKQYAAF